MFQWRALVGDYKGHLGLALAHPFYIALGSILGRVSQEHLPLMLNCLSGVGMAIALGNLAGTGKLLTGKAWVGLLTAAMLAVTHTTWWLSTIAEVYTWSVAGLTAEIWILVLLLRRPSWTKLLALAFINGLGLCVHNFSLLPLPVYLTVGIVLTAKQRVPLRALLLAPLAWMIGAGAYLVMIADLGMSTGSWAGAVRSALVGDYAEQVTNLISSSPRWKENAFLSGMNFLGLLAPLAVVGWIRWRSTLTHATAAVLGIITLIHVLFFIRYPVPDQFTFILPTLAMLTLGGAAGLAVLVELSRKWRTALVAACILSLIWQPVIYAFAPSLVKRVAGDVRRRRELAFRDEVSYWLIPWKHGEKSAERFAAASLTEAAPDGVIIPDGTSGYALKLYQRLWGVHPGVTIQFAGSPIRSGEPTLEELRAAFTGRRIHTVANVLGYAPPCLIENDLLTRGPGDILYTVRWNDP